MHLQLKCPSLALIGKSGFNFMFSLQQIVVNFTTNLLCFDQGTGIMTLSKLKSIVKDTTEVSLKKHYDLSCFYQQNICSAHCFLSFQSIADFTFSLYDSLMPLQEKNSQILKLFCFLHLLLIHRKVGYALLHSIFYSVSSRDVI